MITLSVWIHPQVKSVGVDGYFMKYLFCIGVFALSMALHGCGGGGGGGGPSSGDGSGDSPASDLQTSSYGYKLALSQLEPQVQASSLTGLSVTDADTRNVVTFGDFFQEGSGAFSAFVMVNQPGGYAQPFFFKRIGSTWVNKTSDVLDAGTTGCATASSAITADFNGDGRHDVFVTCKGGTGEAQWLFISNASTRVFQKIPLLPPSSTPYNFKATQAAAADINADGVMDLVIAVPASGPQVLLGTAPANATIPTFSVASPARLVDGTLSTGDSLPHGIHGVRLIPNVNPSIRWDLILMGDSTNGNSVWKITGSSDTTVGTPSPGTFFYFQNAYAKAFPIASSGAAPWIANDVFMDGGAYYLNLYRSDQPQQMTLAKVDLNLAGEVLARQTTLVTSDGVSAQLLPTSAGIVVYDGDCLSQSIAASSSRCSTRFNK